MNKLKKIIIILSIVLIGAIILLTLLNKKNKIKENEQIISEIGTTPIVYKTELTAVELRHTYYAVKKCIENYYAYCQNLNVSNCDILYNILDKEYINSYNITKNNMVEKFSKNKENEIMLLNKMYYINGESGLNAYLVVGKNINTKTLNKKIFAIIVKVDDINKTYSIFPEDYCESKKYSELKLGDKIDVSIENSLEKNANNTYQFKPVHAETYIQDIWEDYKDRARYDVALSYEYLDNEYKEKRFGNLDNYKAYIEENLEQIDNIFMESFKIQNQDGYTQYVCQADDENYYIIKIKNAMEYTLVLDTYTIDVPEFIEKYNASTEQEKVAMNLQKIEQALNNKDYNYIYNKLDETFRKNNFGSLEEFTNYAKENFFEKNEMKFLEFKNNSGIYTYRVQMINENLGHTAATKGKTEQKEHVFIMKLNEGTDFVMSFEV